MGKKFIAHSYPYKKEKQFHMQFNTGTMNDCCLDIFFIGSDVGGKYDNLMFHKMFF